MADAVRDLPQTFRSCLAAALVLFLAVTGVAGCSPGRPPPLVGAPVLHSALPDSPHLAPAEGPWALLASSIRLAQVYASDRLTIVPIASPPGGSAVRIEERIPQRSPVFGREMQRASRVMAAAFADDPTYGAYLAMVFDPQIEDGEGLDHLPPLAFVWNRPEVERYAACGIPAVGLYNDCSAQFTHAAEVAELPASETKEPALRSDPGRR